MHTGRRCPREAQAGRESRRTHPGATLANTYQVQCVADGDEVSKREPCDSVVGKLEGDPEKEVTIGGGSYSLGCENECHVVIYPKVSLAPQPVTYYAEVLMRRKQNGDEITITQSALIGDIKHILNSCADDGSFVGTFTEESGPLGRRTEITKYPYDMC